MSRGPLSVADLRRRSHRMPPNVELFRVRCDNPVTTRPFTAICWENRHASKRAALGVTSAFTTNDRDAPVLRGVAAPTAPGACRPPGEPYRAVSVRRRAHAHTHPLGNAAAERCVSSLAAGWAPITDCCEVTETVSLGLDPQKRQWISDKPESSCCTTSFDTAVGSSPVESWIPQRAGRRIPDIRLNCLSIFAWLVR